MALNSLLCADVPLRNCSLTHSLQLHNHLIWLCHLQLLKVHLSWLPWCDATVHISSKRAVKQLSVCVIIFL